MKIVTPHHHLLHFYPKVLFSFGYFLMASDGKFVIYSSSHSEKVFVQEKWGKTFRKDCRQNKVCMKTRPLRKKAINGKVYQH